MFQETLKRRQTHFSKKFCVNAVHLFNISQLSITRLPDSEIDFIFIETRELTHDRSHNVHTETAIFAVVPIDERFFLFEKKRLVGTWIVKNWKNRLTKIVAPLRMNFGLTWRLFWLSLLWSIAAEQCCKHQIVITKYEISFLQTIIFFDGTENRIGITDFTLAQKVGSFGGNRKKVKVRNRTEGARKLNNKWQVFVAFRYWIVTREWPEVGQIELDRRSVLCVCVTRLFYRLVFY